MRRYLKETHPLCVKFEQLIAQAETIGLRLVIEHHQFSVIDNATQIQAVVTDLEPSYHTINDFPPSLDYRLQLVENKE